MKYVLIFVVYSRLSSSVSLDDYSCKTFDIHTILHAVVEVSSLQKMHAWFCSFKYLSSNIILA